jgi:hypothetical protein
MKGFRLDFWGRMTICLLPAFLFAFLTIFLGESSPVGRWTAALMWLTGGIGFFAAQIWDAKAERNAKPGGRVLPFRKE